MYVGEQGGELGGEIVKGKFALSEYMLMNKSVYLNMHTQKS